LRAEGRQDTANPAFPAALAELLRGLKQFSERLSGANGALQQIA
jgi:hypothetical protein